MRPMRAALLLLLLASSFALTACTPAPSSLATKTIVLKPTTLETQSRQTHRSSTAWYCETTFVSSSAPFDPKDDMGLVGFTNQYEAGSDPLPCFLLNSFEFRTAVRFSLPDSLSADRVFIQSAILSWDESSRVIRSADGAVQPKNTQVCAAQVIDANANISSNQFIDGDQIGGIKPDVAGIVRAWARRDEVNNGFGIRPVPGLGAAQNHAACIGDIGAIRLTITFRAP